MATGAIVGRSSLPPQVTVGRIVAIGRRLAPASVLEIGTALQDAGVGAFEIDPQRARG